MSGDAPSPDPYAERTARGRAPADRRGYRDDYANGRRAEDYRTGGHRTGYRDDYRTGDHPAGDYPAEHLGGQHGRGHRRGHGRDYDDPYQGGHEDDYEQANEHAYEDDYEDGFVGDLTDDDGRPSRGRRGGRAAKQRAARRRRKRAFGVLIVLVLLAGLAGGAYLGLQQLRGIGNVPDYSGDGDGDVVIEVAEGAFTSDIATVLAEQDVVKSGRAFVQAAESVDEIRNVQPGFYRMRTRMSGAAAANLIVSPESRVGQLEIRGGTQLHDVQLPDDTVVPGVMSLIHQASCAELNGESTCVETDALFEAMATADPAELGVPEWTLRWVTDAEPERRLEGLLLPGVYNLKPGSSAVELLKAMLASSTVRLQATAITDETKDTGFAPYELLTMASLIEREGITEDFGKVSRVIYKRLAVPQRLQLDSTVNYPLDRQEVRTNDEARASSSPYNTYRVTGLPPTPIGAPGEAAIAAALEPEPGDWLYFNKCEKDGKSCFSVTQEEHDANVADARARGVF